jgi:hypothetical protein
VEQANAPRAAAKIRALESLMTIPTKRARTPAPSDDDEMTEVKNAWSGASRRRRNQEKEGLEAKPQEEVRGNETLYTDISNRALYEWQYQPRVRAVSGAASHPSGGRPRKCIAITGLSFRGSRDQLAAPVPKT